MTPGASHRRNHLFYIVPDAAERDRFRLESQTPVLVFIVPHKWSEQIPRSCLLQRRKYKITKKNNIYNFIKKIAHSSKIKNYKNNCCKKLEKFYDKREIQ